MDYRYHDCDFRLKNGDPCDEQAHGVDLLDGVNHPRCRDHRRPNSVSVTYSVLTCGCFDLQAKTPALTRDELANGMQPWFYPDCQHPQILIA